MKFKLVLIAIALASLTACGGGSESSPTVPPAPPAPTPVVQDSDNDGVTDTADSCPSTPSGDTVDASGCSVVADSDGDGIADDIDSCPSTPSGDVVDASGCTVVADSDGDGIADDIDNCPSTPSGDVVDASGCTVVADSDGDGIADDIDSCPSTPSGDVVDASGCTVVADSDGDGIADEFDSCPNTPQGATVDAEGCPVDSGNQVNVEALFDQNTLLEPASRFVRDDGVLVTRIGDRGRDRHAKDITIQDHYDHYLAHYWEYRTVRIQLEDYVPKGQSLIRTTFITEAKLGAREFRVWFWGRNTTGQFHFNPQKEEEKVSQNETGVVYVGKGTWNDNFEKISDQGIQHKYTLDIVNKWETGGQFQKTLTEGTNMEFEVSLFLLSPPAGSRLNYYGTSFVYVIGQLGVAPFEWQRGVENAGGANDGTPIPAAGLLGGDTTLGYNYSEEPAGRFMQMATNLSSQNAQAFVEGRRVHHTNFDDGTHDERHDNPVWTEQIGKIGNHYINHSCAACHVRNGKALVEDVGGNLDKWVFKVGDENGAPDSLIGQVLQPQIESNGTSEGNVTLGPWTNHENGLRSPNYVFSERRPAQFSARIAPQLVGLGLLEAVPEEQVVSWVDANDANNDGISGRASIVKDPISGVNRLGRFGYKASTFSVKHQTASAFNTDLGVMTSMLPNPDCGSAQTDCGSAEVELSDQNLDKLVKYLSLLGVGARRDYNSQSGARLFSDAGCASCHRPSMTTSAFHPLAELRNQTIHPYTDLLLHDMGPGLADSLAEGSASGAEWRTAALWGLGHAENVMLGDAKANDAVSLAGRSDDDTRIGYLHDGRARTIEEAILWHGGEGEASKQAYVAMSTANKAALLSFLKSL